MTTKTVGALGEVSVWSPAGREPLAVFVALHGIQSNQRWYGPLGEELSRRGYELWAYTRPGRAMSAGEKPVADAASDEEWLAQLRSVAKAARRPGRPLIAMGVSWGARPVLASVLQEPAQWSGAVVLNPALATRKDASFLLRALGAGAPLLRESTFAIPLSAADYSEDQNTRREWLVDERLTTRCTTRFFGRTASLRKRTDGRLAELERPTLALLGASDPLVPHDKVERMLNAAKNRHIEVASVSGGTHSMLVERPADLAERIESWLRLSTLR